MIHTIFTIICLLLCIFCSYLTLEAIRDIIKYRKEVFTDKDTKIICLSGLLICVLGTLTLWTNFYMLVVK